MARSDAGSDIFTILPDGSDRRRITFSGAGQPTWAPEGRRLAYSQGGDIWIGVTADRWNRTQVTSGDGLDSDPAWSPDGDRLAFTRDSAIVVLDLNSGTEKTLTTPSDQWLSAFQPAWSPDSTRIAYVQESSDDDDYDNYRRLFVMNADGTDQHQVPNSDSFAHNPSWSPDGSTLLYSHRYYGRGYCEDVILSIHPNGSQPRRVMKQGCLSAAGTWSPTGGRVALVMGGPVYDFDAGDDPRLTGIWTVRPDGTGHRRLVVRHGWDPAWQPTAVSRFTPGADQRTSQLEGRRMAFTATSSDGWDVFTVRPDGRGVHRLTHAGDAMSPNWSPDHQRIAYVTDENVRVMSRSGDHKRRVGSGGWNEVSWSPDGRHLVVSWTFNIGVINLRSGRERTLDIDAYQIGRAVWSPNGRWLAFSAASPRFGQSEVYRVRPNGSRMQRITRTPGSESEPSWSKNGRRIAFTYSPPGTAETDVRTMRRNGVASQIVAEPAGMDYSPAWSPSGRQIAFYSEGPDPYGDDPRPGLWVSAADGGHHRMVFEKREVQGIDW